MHHSLAFLLVILLWSCVVLQVAANIEPFDLADVQLGNETIQSYASSLNLEYLFMLEPDRVLWTFRRNAGLPTPNQPFNDTWEAPEIEVRGQFMGHYLTALSYAFRSTGDPRLKERIEYLVTELQKVQTALGTGYLSAFPAEHFDRLQALQYVWAPYYVIHKIMNGLLDTSDLANNQLALGMVTGIANYFFKRIVLTLAVNGTDHWHQMLETEFGGMNDVMYRLYRMTKNPMHLYMATLFDKPNWYEPLVAGQDAAPGRHANTHLAQVNGFAARYVTMGQQDAFNAVSTFFDTLTANHSYATGGSNDNEFWGPANQLSDAVLKETVATETEETCTQYNILKVARSLFMWTGSLRYADFYERALLNGIVGAMRSPPRGGLFKQLLPSSRHRRSLHHHHHDHHAGGDHDDHAARGPELPDKSKGEDSFEIRHLRDLHHSSPHHGSDVEQGPEVMQASHVGDDFAQRHQGALHHAHPHSSHGQHADHHGDHDLDGGSLEDGTLSVEHHRHLHHQTHAGPGEPEVNDMQKMGPHRVNDGFTQQHHMAGAGEQPSMLPGMGHGDIFDGLSDGMASGTGGPDQQEIAGQERQYTEGSKQAARVAPLHSRRRHHPNRSIWVQHDADPSKNLPGPGVYTYLMPMGSGQSKGDNRHGWGYPFHSFWCCYGTAVESFAKLHDSIFFQDMQPAAGLPRLYVNQLVTSTLTWRQMGVVVEMEADMFAGRSASVNITIRAGSSATASFAMMFRLPSWMGVGSGVQAASLLLNGSPWSACAPLQPASFCSISRAWQSGDTVSAVLPMKFHWRSLPENRTGLDNLTAIMMGPLVMAGLTHDTRVLQLPSPMPDLETIITDPPSGPAPVSFKVAWHDSAYLRHDRYMMYASAVEDSGDALDGTFRLLQPSSTPCSTAVAHVNTHADSANSTVMLEPMGLPGFYMGYAEDGTLRVSMHSQQDAEWCQRHRFLLRTPGLMGEAGSVSLEAAGKPGFFVSAFVGSDNIRTPCDDGQVYCPDWAKHGECSRNPDYMSNLCRLSCGMCQAMEGVMMVQPANASVPGFALASTFYQTEGLAELPQGSKLLKALNRDYLLAPLGHIVDERYTAYFELAVNNSHLPVNSTAS